MFINWPTILLNNEPENPPDWIILDIWALESFISVDILFSKAFHNLVFCLVVKGYLCYKTITSQKTPSEAHLKNFFGS